MTASLKGGAPKSASGAPFCTTRHRPLRFAQSGYRGADGLPYCKPCLREKFPELHAAKQKSRVLQCPLCESHAQLIGGICKPCRTSRACATCKDINNDPAAHRCSRCPAGAREKRLALWCGQCTTDADREPGYCQLCLDKYGGIACEHCNAAIRGRTDPYKCPEVGCSRPFHICESCKSLKVGGARLQCKACWHTSGMFCIICRSQGAQVNLNKFRCCRSCHSKWFCHAKGCGRAYMGGDVTMCYACTDSPAMWCSSCCMEQELTSGLCRKCHREISKSCQYCWADSAECQSSWQPCSADGCPRSCFHCGACSARCHNGRLLCRPCWRNAGGLCIECDKTPAQNMRQYKHSCKECIAKVGPDRHYALVKNDSDQYLARSAITQQWDGTEPALQVLLLPVNPSQPSAQYSESPEYLTPEHCGLCLHPAVGASLTEHLLEAHQLTVPAYRERMLRQALTNWPPVISPQVIRSRLAAFKQEMCDANFRMLPCACCARNKRQCKLTAVVFPPPDALLRVAHVRVDF